MAAPADEGSSFVNKVVVHALHIVQMSLRARGRLKRVVRVFEGETPCCIQIAVILLILWLLGFVSGYTIGAF